MKPVKLSTLMRRIKVTNEIRMFLHCGECLNERPKSVSPRSWAQLEVGWTKLGLQVWCKRHEINVIHIDFQGMKHPARLDIARKANRNG